MPQSANVRQSEIQKHPEHAAETAATGHGKASHPSAHEETVQAEEHTHEADAASKLHHGKAAAAEAAKRKK